MGKRKKKTQSDPNVCEEVVSQSGLGQMRDWGNGMMSMALGSNSGSLWTVRMPDGSLAACYVWEHRELWYANVVLFEGPAGAMAFERLEGLGPYVTRHEASHWTGIKAGLMARRLNPEVDDSDEGDFGTDYQDPMGPILGL